MPSDIDVEIDGERPAKKRASRPRPNSLSVDLKEWKVPFVTWCRANGTTPTDALCRMVARVIGGRAASELRQGRAVKGEGERASVKRKIALTPSEFLAVTSLAEGEGFSVPKWLVALVRARLTGEPQPGQAELEQLTRSNVALLAIGRNLNQIAKVLNSNPRDHAAYNVALIEELEASIKAHAKIVSAVMTSNAARWRVTL